MTIIDIINKKRNRKELTREEIEYAVNGYLDGSVKDYQMSSLLMSIVLNGMTARETIDLTDIMIKSGDVLDLSKIDGIIVDKHSTGGVGDKVTLVLGPLLASLGIKIAKMSGRGLGHTGGTIDKLESIEGFNTKISEKKFIKQVNDINIALVGQTADLVPADKKIYALRDVTGTVESLPLIASSIMSKKIASGADIIMIDVKVGNGALMKNIDSAKALARLMVKIGKAYRKPTICLITNMEEPLGNAVGNALEVKEAIDTLKGNGPSDLLEVVITLCSIIIGAINKISNDEAKNLLFKQLNNGEAYKKFEELVKAQGGKINSLKTSDKVFSIKSDREGYINNIDTLHIGEIAKKIGAGRNALDDKIDYEVGLVLNKKVGDYVEKEEELIKVYLKDKDISISEILECFTIEEELKSNPKLILDIIK
ncbi:MAG: thymidine phosphorylase [Bacilli bacterium]|nr:thymidine phosphorylase [Bacilli bacterium]